MDELLVRAIRRAKAMMRLEILKVLAGIPTGD